MKTSADSATSANSSNNLYRVFPNAIIAMIAILATGALPSSAGAQVANPYEPEIVRLGYVQGDVRLSRGSKNNADLNTSWEIAQANVPIEEGFTLATGVGRAEIEFENGSVVYLADNSVLEFNRLDATFTVPATELELVTGTLTLSAKPAPREIFVISTPSERLSFPKAALVRVDSFLDGVTATPENDQGDDVIEYGGDATPPPGAPITTYFNGIRYTVNMPAGLANAINDLAARNMSNKTHLDGGQPITYQNSKRVTGNIANDSTAPADWDAWVLARVTKREQEMSAALKASGLTASVPGLIDMYESGTFYPCAPEGNCWRPNGVDNSDGVIDLGDGAVLPDGSAVASNPEISARLIASLGAPVFPADGFSPLQSQQSSQQSQSAQQGTIQQRPPGTIPAGVAQNPIVTVYHVRLDECSDEVHRQEVASDPVTGKKTILRETIERDPWMWGLCYSGGWAPFRGRYRFVAGRTHHHPVHYMHVGTKNVWVPRNPHDVRGQTPLNLKNGAFATGKKQDRPLQFVKWNPADKVTLLTKTPKEFRPSEEKSARIPVQRPEIQARFVTRNPVTTSRTHLDGKVTPVAFSRTGERTITYNYHAKTFERASGELVGGHASAKPEVVGHFTANGQFNNGANGSSRGNGTTVGGRTSGGGGNGGYSGGG
ncbi:MAG TPA: FecR family protein, partial [Candidatus Acidoferrales bacterium]